MSIKQTRGELDIISPTIIAKLKNAEISTLTRELENCKAEIKHLKTMNTISMTPKEQFHYSKRLEILNKKKVLLSNKLSLNGYKAEKRGRPTKNAEEKYKSTHTRITCYFSPENVLYLKQLKKDNIIKNISSFIDDILTAYIHSSKDGK